MNWYQDPRVDEGVIISSRIRLARNIKKFPFNVKISDEQALQMLEETKASIINDRTPLSSQFDWFLPEEHTQTDRMVYLERHVISPEFVSSRHKRGVLLRQDESVSIMINEEDHVRIQTISPGDNMDEAWDLADKIDNLIEETLEYAFDKDYGYLTSCPTNTGTGLRASFMVHIPMLERTGQLTNVAQTIAKFGMTVRGIHGEGTEPMGSIYQISNQVTLGKSEEEIIGALKKVAGQIMDSENLLRNTVISQQKDEITDRLYRAYGVLRYCRRISAKEAMALLSDLRMGLCAGLLKIDKPAVNIYNMMMNIQPGHVQKQAGRELTPSDRDEVRAEYIRSMLSGTEEEQPG